MLMLAGQAFAQPYQFMAIDVSCAATAAASECPAGLAPGQIAAQTSAKGINARGNVVGLYFVGGKQHGFLLEDGHYTSLDFPISGVRGTAANGSNARGEIVGQYVLPVTVKDANGADLPEDSPLYCPADLPSPPNPRNTADPACIKGFRYWHGKFSTLTFPSTVDENGQQHKHPGAIAQRITDDGDIYGCLHDHDLGASMHGAAWTRFDTFSLTTNGNERSDGMDTPMSMNNGGTPGGGHTIVGFFMAMDMTTMQTRQHGYVVRDGMLDNYDATFLDIEHALPPLTAIWDINANQEFVGTYRESGEAVTKRHGFVQKPDGSVRVTLDFTCQETAGCPDVTFNTVAFSTTAFGVNPAGVIVGQYVNGVGTHGFIAIPGIE
jgi:hypothetical protein